MKRGGSQRKNLGEEGGGEGRYLGGKEKACSERRAE